MLGAGARDSDGVAFLECIIADQMGRDLPGDHHQWDGIHQGVGQAGHSIGRARAGGHQNDARLAGRARIAFGGMDRALLVPHEHMDQLIVLEQRIIDGQHRAAGIAENVAYALVFERANHDFRPGQFHAFRQICRRRDAHLFVHAALLTALTVSDSNERGVTAPENRVHGLRSLSFVRTAVS